MGDSNYSKTNKTNDRAIQRASEPTQRKINDAICKKDAKGNYGPVCSAVHCGWHGAMVAKDNVVNLGKTDKNIYDTSYDLNRMKHHCPNVFNNKKENTKK
jgi:hypothetical protein